MPDFPVKTVAVSSLCRILPEIDPQAQQKNTFSCLKNEPLSFQLAFKLTDENAVSLPFNLRIESDLPFSLYSEGAVPVLQMFDPNLDDRFRSGVMYDMLLPKKVNPELRINRCSWGEFCYDGDKTQLHATGDSWKAVWLTVNEAENEIPAGAYDVRLKLYSRSGNELVGACVLTVEVVDALLPKQELLYTNWFHCDCLCDTYGVKMFSERFWEIFRNFALAAAKNGMNMILTPCFTPPLDTPVGSERMTAQLVGVEVENGNYRFDFSMLKRFIEESRKCGIEYFEHSHFFTQWGAANAPKVMATVDGRLTRIFGWETEAAGEAYTGFLRSYIPQLLEFLKTLKVDKNFLFHISDEPRPKRKENYQKAAAIVRDLLDGYMLGDALSHYEFYEDGTVQIPIVATDCIHDFLGKCDDLWAYYTGGQCNDGLSNRKLNCSPERNRMIGVQLYYHKIKGFLHWGYNFYYDELSQGLFDPKTEPCLYRGANPGTPFCVYPATDGSCIQSIRQKIFYEGLNDIRALQTLEKRIGRRETEALIEQHFGKVDFYTHAGSAEKLLAFREAVNTKIRNAPVR